MQGRLECQIVMPYEPSLTKGTLGGFFVLNLICLTKPICYKIGNVCLYFDILY